VLTNVQKMQSLNASVWRIRPTIMKKKNELVTLYNNFIHIHKIKLISISWLQLETVHSNKWELILIGLSYSHSSKKPMKLWKFLRFSEKCTLEHPLGYTLKPVSFHHVDICWIQVDWDTFGKNVPLNL